MGVPGWISFWLVDRHGEKIRSFSSLVRAERWVEDHRDDLKHSEPEDNVDKDKLREAKSLTKKLGLIWEYLSEEEKQEWITEVSD